MQPVPLQPRDVEPGQAPRWMGRFDGLRGDVETSAGRLALQLDLAGLQLSGPELDFEVGRWSARWETTLAADAERAQSEHALADLRLELRPDAAPDEPLRVEVRGAAWKSDSDRDALRWVGTAAGGTWNDLHLTGVRLDASWPRDPGAGDEEPASGGPAALGFLPEWHIEQLEGRLPDGPFLLSGELRLATPALVPGQEIPPASGLHGDLELRFPRPWAEALLADHPERLEAWLAEGQVARDRDALRTRLMWNDQGWLANGLPVETDGWLDKLVPEAVTAAALAAAEVPGQGDEASREAGQDVAGEPDGDEALAGETSAPTSDPALAGETTAPSADPAAERAAPRAADAAAVDEMPAGPPAAPQR